MFSNVNVDCCKTLGCKNLGVLNSVDYVAQGKIFYVGSVAICFQ